MWFPPPPVLGVCTCCELADVEENEEEDVAWVCRSSRGCVCCIPTPLAETPEPCSPSIQLAEDSLRDQRDQRRGFLAQVPQEDSERESSESIKWVVLQKNPPEREREEEKERRGEREREKGSWKIINYPQQVLLCATKAQMHYQVLLRLNLKRSQTLLSGLRGGRSVFLACSPLHHLTFFFLDKRYIRGLLINVMEMVLSQETQEPKFCLSALLHLSISLIFN